MTFTLDSPLLSLCLKLGRYLQISLQIHNYYHPTRDELKFYGFHRRFLIESTLPEMGWIFIAFTISFQLFSF